MSPATPYYPIPELHLVGVAEPGVPNKERLVIRPTETLQLNGYAITLGVRIASGTARAIYDNCFWFPDQEVKPPSWILVFTGKGMPRQYTWEETPVFSFHWQREFTLFSPRVSLLVPVLFRVDAADVGELLHTQPQLSE